MTSKTVMVIEDNDLNRKLFNDVLEVHGFQAVSVPDGTTALALARQNPPDLIVLDIQLPRYSGLTVLQWFREDRVLRCVPALAVTAFATKSDEQIFRNAGFEGFLSKPVTVDAFMSAIHQNIAS